MKKGSFIATLFILGNSLLSGQSIPGLTYCLLFDSYLEKQAFQRSNQNDCDPLIFLLTDNPQINSGKYLDVKSELAAYANKLALKKEKFTSDQKYIRYVFYDVHKKYLRKYNSQESFSEVFTRGRYNCVSGVALYACLLSQLGYQAEIYETRFHLFLMVELHDGSRIMLESTDPSNGFITSQLEAGARLQKYLTNEREQLETNMSSIIMPPFNNKSIMEGVSLKELSGLHYYNIAVKFLNQKNYLDALRALKKASILYPTSERILHLLQFTLDLYETELSVAFN